MQIYNTVHYCYGITVAGKFVMLSQYKMLKLWLDRHLFIKFI